MPLSITNTIFECKQTQIFEKQLNYSIWIISLFTSPRISLYIHLNPQQIFILFLLKNYLKTSKTSKNTVLSQSVRHCWFGLPKGNWYIRSVERGRWIGLRNDVWSANASISICRCDGESALTHHRSPHSSPCPSGCPFNPWANQYSSCGINITFDIGSARVREANFFQRPPHVIQGQGQEGQGQKGEAQGQRQKVR